MAEPRSGFDDNALHAASITTMRRANLPIVLFGILVALCFVTGIAFVIEETPYEDVPAPGGGVQRVRAGHGVTHAEFASMDHGGPGAERHAPISTPVSSGTR